MTSFVVTLEFAATADAVERSDVDMQAVVEIIRGRFDAPATSVVVTTDHILTAVTVDVADRVEALAWGRTVLHDVVSEALPDWRLADLRVQPW